MSMPVDYLRKLHVVTLPHSDDIHKPILYQEGVDEPAASWH